MKMIRKEHGDTDNFKRWNAPLTCDLPIYVVNSSASEVEILRWICTVVTWYYHLPPQNHYEPHNQHLSQGTTWKGDDTLLFAEEREMSQDRSPSRKNQWSSHWRLCHKARSKIPLVFSVWLVLMLLMSTLQRMLWHGCGKEARLRIVVKCEGFVIFVLISGCLLKQVKSLIYLGLSTNLISHLILYVIFMYTFIYVFRILHTAYVCMHMIRVVWLPSQV